MLMDIKKLSEKLYSFSRNFYLNDIWNYRDIFFKMSDQELLEYPFCIAGKFLVLAMMGKLDEAHEVQKLLQPDSILYKALRLVDPTSTMSEIISVTESFEKNDQSLLRVTLTAGRPSLLNGFGDFTKLAVLLPGHREDFMNAITVLYGQSTAFLVYELSYAEKLYRMGKLNDAEIHVSHTIHSFDDKGDMRCLFVALYLQLKLLMATGHNVNVQAYVADMRDRLNKNGYNEFSYNLDAVEAWASTYDGYNEKMVMWLKNSAPDEYGDFNMLDTFRYMVKLHCYIVIENHVALISLVEKLRPLLEKGHRLADLCMLDVILAMDLHAQGKKEEAFVALERSLKVVRRYKMYRTIADEGERMLLLLIDYVNQKGEDDFLLKLIDMTRKMSIYFPYYLKPAFHTEEKFSDMEVDILYLLEQGKSKEEISERFFISENTVKYHMKKIYKKLNANSANQAVWNAKLLGLLIR